MEILTALVVLSVAAGVRPADQVTCQHPVLCPCGNTGKEIKVCIEEEDPCKRWSRCKACQDGLDGCLECPEGLEGPLCLKVTAPEVLSRQRRQRYTYRPFGGNSPSQYRPERQTEGECLNPGAIANGRIVYYPPPDSRRDGRPRIAPADMDFPVGSILRYACASRYHLMGSSSISCGDTGKWSSEPPVCMAARKPCSNPGPFSNGRTEYYPPLILGRRGQPQSIADQPEFPNGGLILYSCDRGFTLQGSDALTCEDDGEWSAAPPFCRGANRPCLNPGPFSNGRTLYYPTLVNGRRGKPQSTTDLPEFPNGGVILYFCDSGFSLQGSDFLTCEDDGEWSAELPVCIREVPSQGSFCAEPGIDPNGRRDPPLPPDRRGFPDGTMLEYFCNQGYELQGEMFLECLSGNWESRIPSCKPEAPEVPNQGSFCAEPGIDPNGSRDPPSPPDRRGFPDGITLVYFCNEGYELEGDIFLQCSSGNWESRIPSCKPEAPEIPNQDSFCAEPGIDPNGSRDPLSPPNRRGFPDGTMLEYSCNQGYEIEGEMFLRCLSGKWESQIPSCKPEAADVPNTGSFCAEPGVDPNGSRDPPSPPVRRGFPDGFLLVYICNQGYELEGDMFLHCSSGNWDSPIPSCKPEVPGCANPGPLLNGRMRDYRHRLGPRFGSTSLDAEDTEIFPEDTRLDYNCDDGFDMTGSPSITCLSTGEWTELPPSCEPVCGRATLGSRNTIHLRGTSDQGEWPWVVWIATQNLFICGGAVINTRTVLTAANCVAKDSSYVLYFGKHYSDDMRDDELVQSRTSERVIIHPDFNKRTFDSDIALVQFEPLIKFSMRVQPICLPSAQTTAVNLQPGNKGFVAGWGSSEMLPLPELKTAHLAVRSNSDCAVDGNTVITENMFCSAEFDGREGACQGDAGSPFVFNDNRTRQFTVEGLLSFGPEGDCRDPNKPAFFTKVFRFVDWIYKNMR